MKRVVAYIDGFNLYYGLREKGWRKYYWLDVQALVRRLLLGSESLIRTKYFTARISGPSDKQVRQSTYLQALGTLSEFEIIYGVYQANRQTCYKCHSTFSSPKEKMTDVDIAVEMLRDAFQGSFDVALLLSADSDLTPPLVAIRQLFPALEVRVAFPPARSSKRLQQVAHAHIAVREPNLAASLFPAQVVKRDGFVLTCPLQWR